MKKSIKLGFASLVVFLGLGLTSCANEQSTQETDTVETVATETAPAAGVSTASSMATDASAPVDGPSTTITFDTPVYDFGTRKTGEMVEYVYTFTNTGSEPLVISNAKGSCGCTVPEWPKEPIPAGANGEIKVRFDGKGKTGSQSKNVTITANTNPPTTILTIKGNLEGTPEGAQ